MMVVAHGIGKFFQTGLSVPAFCITNFMFYRLGLTDCGSVSFNESFLRNVLPVLYTYNDYIYFTYFVFYWCLLMPQSYLHLSVNFVCTYFARHSVSL